MPTRVNPSARGSMTVLAIWQGQIGILGGSREATGAN